MYKARIGKTNFTFQGLTPIRPIRIIESEEIIDSQFSDYLKDESKFTGGKVQYLAFPETEQQVSEFLVRMNRQKIPVTVSAGRTGVTGAGIPLSGALMSVEKMNKILGIRKNEKGEWLIAVQPGVILGDFNKMVEEKDSSLFYPVDVTETSARLGGTVSTNASGSRSFRYGQTRKWVEGLRVVLTNGDVLDIKRGQVFANEKREFKILLTDNKTLTVKLPEYTMPNVKNAAGYYVKDNMDLIDLFIGSEGTLGVITEIELKIIKKPENVLLVIAFFPTENDGVEFFLQAKEEFRKEANVFEYFDENALEILRKKRKKDGVSSNLPEFPENANSSIFLELEYTDENLNNLLEQLEKLLIKHNSSMELTWGGTEKKDIEKVKFLRHALPEATNELYSEKKRKCTAIHKIGTDMVTPIKYLKDIISYYKKVISNEKLDYAIFGHIGESHLHVNIFPSTEEELGRAKQLYINFSRKVTQLGGTISGEHGIGKTKHAYLEVMYGKEAIRQMVALKKTLDPNCILGRGNIFPEELLI